MNPSDDASPPKDEFEQVADKLKSSNSILVTISTDPTVDQFAACIGLTLILNKLNKHANAVFSGKVPSTLDFLKPEKTLEKDTDSLRDFIIALDKAKADKLRYKVEDDVVKIFITPYKTSIDEKDLQFSQGDFNVDAIVAIGVQDKAHIDQAILAHGRILHDAAVISINTAKQSRVGSINWSDSRASSLCEMVADVAMELDNKVFDSQNSTALLTGIVAETDRYSNEKAAPHTMSVAGILMSAGASTQLVSSQLKNGSSQASSSTDSTSEEAEQDGVLEIAHQPEPAVDTNTEPQTEVEEVLPPQLEEPFAVEDDIPPPPVEPAVDKETPPESKPEPESTDKKPKAKSAHSRKPRQRVIHEPPEFTGKLTANSEPEDNQYPSSVDPFSNLPDTPMLNRNGTDASTASDDNSKKTLADIDDTQTLTDIERAVDSPHVDEHTVIGSTAPSQNTAPVGVDDARDAVLQAEITSEMNNPIPEPRQSIGSTELGSDLNVSAPPPGSTPADPNNTKDTPPPPVPPPYLPPSA